MQAGRFERILNKIEGRLGRVNKKLIGETKNDYPFGKKPLSRKQKIEQYLSITPEQDQTYVQSFGETYMNYKSKMEDEIRRYSSGR